MPKLTVNAPAKINLTFDILGTMPDGYHEVQTILQSIDLADRLEFDINPAAELSVKINCANEIVPLGPENLVAKSAKAFCERAEESLSISVELEKNIPIGAGLAGGSADAAATLVALNEAAGKPLSDESLLELGGTIGADVPFCIAGGTKYGTRRGDILESVENKVELVFCVIKPRTLAIGTPWAYDRYDKFPGLKPKPKTVEALKYLRLGDTEKALTCFGNVFQQVMFSVYPQLGDIHAEINRHGALYAQLSGSGPAIFAVCPDLEHAHFLRRQMQAFSPDLEVHFCHSTQHGVVITEHNNG